MDIFIYKTLELPAEIIKFWKIHQTHPFHDYDIFKIVIKNRGEYVEPLILVHRNHQQINSLVVARVETIEEKLKLGYLTVFKPEIKTLRIAYEGFLGLKNRKVLEEIFDRIHEFQKENLIDQVVFYRNSEESVFRDALEKNRFRALLEVNRAKREHWYAYLPDDFEQFLKRVKKNHRRHFKSKRNKLSKDHRIENIEYTDKEGIEILFEFAEEVAKNTYQRGMDAGFKNDKETREIFKIAGNENNIRGFVMKIDGKPGAFWIGRLYRGVCYLDYTGYDQKFREYEIGTLSFLDMVGQLISQGVREVDFGMGYAEYKARFCDRMVLEEEVRIFSDSFRGKTLKIKRKITVHATQLFNQRFRNTTIYNRIKKVWRTWIKGLAEKDNQKSS